MKRAVSTPTTLSPSRRSLLAGTPLAALFAMTPHTTLGVAQADRELIDACEEFAAATKARYDAYDAYGAADLPPELEDEFFDRADNAYNRLIEMRATTLTGVLSRAKALVLYDPETAQPGKWSDSGVCGNMTAALLRDLLAAGGVA